ncbi:glycosyltransferase [Segatella bryantii]|uniref:glycosyltransferase n=1 Tax=Segatella bryantii TaxID=77095 RepID=UPI00242BD585|nr:glycosyltransferase [Segatella bryantii]
MKKIKICYIISSLSNQGPPNVLYNIIQYMDFTKFDVSIITMVEEQKVSRIEEFRSLPIKVIQMHPNGVQNPFSMFRTLKKMVEYVNPDIVHAHCPRSLMLIPFLPKKYKKWETIHIFPGIQQKVMYGNFKGQIVIWLSHFFNMHMDKAIACSESVANSYYQKFNYKMLAIPNGCSLPIWKRNLKEKENIRKQLGLRSDLKYFIFVGRFSQEKNPEKTLQAFEELQNEYPNIGLVLLGNGYMYDSIVSHASDRIVVPGFKNNVYDYLKACDFYISASDVEGLPNTLLEAMTVGLPCVLSKIPAHEEVIDKATQPFGFTFDSHNIASQKQAIRNVLAIDTESTAMYIQYLFEKYYTARQMSERYQEEYIKNSISKNSSI